MRDMGAETAPLRPTLGQIAAYAKHTAAKRINRVRNTPGAPVWQRGSHEQIIRNGFQLEQQRRYVAENALRWQIDQDSPSNW